VEILRFSISQDFVIISSRSFSVVVDLLASYEEHLPNSLLQPFSIRHLSNQISLSAVISTHIPFLEQHPEEHLYLPEGSSHLKV